MNRQSFSLLHHWPRPEKRFHPPQRVGTVSRRGRNVQDTFVAFLTLRGLRPRTELPTQLGIDRPAFYTGLVRRRQVRNLHPLGRVFGAFLDRKSTRLNSSHLGISYAVFCLKKKKNKSRNQNPFTPLSWPASTDSFPSLS